MTVDSDFGHWFAGFLDGEGCFGIYLANRRSPNQIAYRFTCTIQLRADDRAILDEIVARTGLGYVTNPSRSRKLAAKPLLRWWVTADAQVRELIGVLDCYPLRAKKAADYALWREGFLVARHDPPRCAEYARRLQECRLYRAGPELVSAKPMLLPAAI